MKKNNDSQKSYSGRLDNAHYTDRITVHGNTVWVDLDEFNLTKINKIAIKSEDWLDFITGLNMHNITVVAGCNGTYALVDTSGSILSIRLPADIRRWVDDEAKKVGVKASTWIRMLLIKEKTKQVEEWIKNQEKEQTK